MQLLGPEKDILDIVAALATPSLALIALVFAALQWYTNNRRLKHELFDRRYPQYIAVQNFLSELGANGAMSQNEEHKFLQGITGIRFTYNNDIAKFVDDVVYKLGMDINLYNDLIKDQAEIEKGAARKRGELIKNTRVVAKEVDAKFSKYIQLKH